MLKFYETYRLESESNEVVFPSLLGAHLLREDGEGVQTWVFWMWSSGTGMGYESPVRSLRFKAFKDLGGGAFEAEYYSGSVEREKVRLYPVTVDYVLAHKDLYAVSAAAAEQLSVPGMLKGFFQCDMDDSYEELYGPKPTVEKVEEDIAPVGAVKMVRGAFYEKQSDGTWVKADWFP